MITSKTISLRPFIGAKDFDLSRNFYRDMGFEEVTLGHHMSVFKTGQLAFYLQNAYVKDWVDNTMLFLEVENVEHYLAQLSTLDLPGKYPGVRLSGIKDEDWGRECFLTDPAGVLWHIGEFNKQ